MIAKLSTKSVQQKIEVEAGSAGRGYERRDHGAGD